MSLSFTAIPKQLFFDRSAVQSAMSRRTARALSKFGAFVRTRARRSMRPGGKSGKSAEPGQPPRYHSKGLRDFIFFAYDRSEESVVIGPLAFNGQGSVKPVGGGTVPELLEEGGLAVVRRGGGRRDRASYAGNPYMQPAFDAESSNLPRIWASA